ncbi:MAG TPA: TRAP transporter substrate-binding protein [Burkholderiales bacterium]|nr:TRAP transporter substrate-binding protein [Burkholderiales bacterium]
MIRFNRIMTAAVAATVVGLAGCGGGGDPETRTVAEPTAVQPLRINLASAYPTSLTLLGEAAPRLADNVRRASAGSIDIRVYEPGALVPGMEAIQAAARGSVDAAWSATGFFSGTDSAFSIFSAIPFGPDIPEYLAWMYFGGGLELQNELLAAYDLYAIPCTLIPPEASGWFRREIRTVEDLRGLKMRFFGLGAKVMEKLGVATQLLAPGDIFQALQLGTIDATEFSLPALDRTLGFHQVAKYYYFPGWHQQATFGALFFNKDRWSALPESQRALLEMACGDMVRYTAAEGESMQWEAMQAMRDQHGVQIKRWSPEIMAALEKAWAEVVAEESAANPNFKRVYDSYLAFRANYALWRDYGYLQ